MMVFFQLVLLIMSIIGALYYIFSTFALLPAFRRDSGSVFDGKISVIKPVCGLDAGLESNLRSHLEQNYPEYEVLFGVLEEKDPALTLLKKLGGDNVCVGSEIGGSNLKVRVLHSLAKAASGEVLVITDADTRVTPDFLEKIASPFSDPHVGAVTCLYRGGKTKNASSALEALHMTCVFAPGVGCHNLTGIDFGLGAAIAVRKSALEAAGGFERLSDYLADDFQLGRIVSGAGYKVKLSSYVVEITLGKESLKNVLRRELRWSVTTRVSRPLGHLGLVFTFGFAYALAFLAASGRSTIGWAVLGGVLTVRMLSALIGAVAYLDDIYFPSRAYLLPIRDLLSFGIWIGSYLTQTVYWRGRTLKVQRNGKMKQEDA